MNPLLVIPALAIISVQPSPAPDPAREAATRISEALGNGATSAIDEADGLIIAVSIAGLTAEDTAFDRRAARTITELAFDLPKPDGWDGVLCLDERNFRRFTAPLLGGRDSVTRGNFFAVGGFYDRDSRRLVSNRLGPNLRHELVHVHHERLQRAQRIRHPAWVIEGLGTLAESVSLTDSGDIRVEPSYRINIAKRLVGAGQFGSITDFAGLTPASFVKARPLAAYARAFAVFLYLERHGQLRPFFGALADPVRGLSTDPTGLLALEQATEMDTATFDRALTGWLREQPFVPEEVRPGMASLGLEISNEPRGLIVTGFARGRRSIGLGSGDAITAIDGLPIRELPELILVLSRYEPRTEIELTRRPMSGRPDETVRVELIPAGR
ncbi:MAG: hypothetical protein AAGB51_07610 [Planctomycetota bacterium]